MAMRIRSPRLFAVVASVLLYLPLVAGIFQARQADLSESEKRTLAPWPHLPRKARDWRALSANVDAFLADHFGLRDAMIALQSRIAYLWLRESNVDVLIGREGRLFYYGDDAMSQSAGETVRLASVQHTIDVLVDMQNVLSARHIKLVVASPPNAASIYDDDLPSWARNAGRETEPDLILNGARAHGLTVVDLRRVLGSARDQGNLYLRSDTHWTLLGAIVGYNAIAAAAGHPDWTIRPDDVMGAPARFDSGDLAQMLGVGDSWPEMTRDWARQSGPVEHIGPAGGEMQVSKGVANGPAVLILGDSFTEGTFAALMARHAGRIGWVHNRNCGFDWSWITTFKPNEVWWAPTERLMLCDTNTSPIGMPRPASVPLGSPGGDHLGQRN